jgi:NAD(P)-dependent dehydrogenase (short-subunit alcohol dehydrogenase family)
MKGKVALVTGAASGIGRATALRLSREGARLVLADLNEAALESVRQEIGSDSFAITYDAGDPASCRDAGQTAG